MVEYLMTEVLLWLAGLAFIILMFWSIVYEYQKKQSRTVEDYQKENESKDLHKLGTSLLRAGLLDLEKIMKPNLQKAVACTEDEKRGMTKQKKAEGDNDGND